MSPITPIIHFAHSLGFQTPVYNQERNRILDEITIMDLSELQMLMNQEGKRIPTEINNEERRILKEETHN